MDIYHFVNYNKYSFEDLIEKNKSNAVLCFDLEDSIQDIFNPERTTILKAYHRELIQKIVNPDNLKIGVRINASNAKEQQLDIASLAGLKAIHTILLPKTESAEQTINLINELDAKKINYTEIIPIIESKTGLLNLTNIAKLNSNKIKSIAFGHCDYNFDVGNFPFFHQDSKEYWTWVEKIVSTIKPYNLQFVNSPFLELDNNSSFEEMLSGLSYICGINYGQITLTFKQSMVCSKFNKRPAAHFHKIPHRLDMRVNDSYTENFIKSFQNGNNNRGFTLSGKTRILLSPQEYQASLNYLKKKEFPEINFTFVGTCFPVQGNIPIDVRFHQLLKRKIENKLNVRFNINILRYERLNKCFEKIVKYKATHPIDILVFCVRPTPMLRITKLSYKHIDSTGKIKRSFNLPFLGLLNPEKYDLLSIEEKFFLGSNNDEPSQSNTVLVNLNYLLGILIGNNRYAMNKYLNMVNEIINFCKQQNIFLIVMGPAIRTNNKMENFLSKKLDAFFKQSLLAAKEIFISGSEMAKDGRDLFHDDGIHVNEYYHELIADRLSGNITKKFTDNSRSRD
ncbi:MAG: hypothetical protein HY841_08625 [Bacteroidetes bacterium]|nr:hypothetical protein [Bacteroidota bacterium]